MKGISLDTDAEAVATTSSVAGAGLLIVNADDWGRDHATTDDIARCALRQRVSSVSAMVFMEDSERAAGIARESGIDAGLHLNLTTPFSAPNCPGFLAKRQREISECVRRYSFSRIIFHPWMTRSFKYVVECQLEEFRRLYGVSPERIDGHHHMHLCSNVVFGGLLPSRVVVRRNFSFLSDEKNIFNRSYRKFVDSVLAKRHGMTDFFFSLPPFAPRTRLERIFSLAKTYTVEVETHPANPGEFAFLMGDEFLKLSENVEVARRYEVRRFVDPRRNGRS